MKITQKEFDNIKNMINSKDIECVKLGINLLNSLFPNYNYYWAMKYYSLPPGKLVINFWLHYIQVHFVE